MTFADLQQGVQNGVEQLKTQRALLQQMESALQAEYDSIFDELKEKRTAVEEAIRQLSKPMRRFTTLEEASTKAAEPPAPPQRKKPGPKPGSKRKKPEPAAPKGRLRVDEETTKEAVIVPPPKPATPPVVETSSRPVEAPPKTEAAPKQEGAKAKKGQLPPGVSLGRNGKPRLLESLTYILKENGQTHLDDIIKKMDELGLLPKSDKPRAYVGYTLSKNPKEFRPVGNKRGIWDLTKAYRTKLDSTPAEAPAPEATSEPEEEADPEVAHLSDDVDLDGIRDMRAAEASANVPSTEEAAKIVDEMTDPNRNAAA